MFISGARRTVKGVSSARPAAAVVLLAFWSLFAIERSPWTFYIYIAFPCFFWSEFLTHSMGSLQSWFGNKSRTAVDFLSVSFNALAVVSALLSMVVSGPKLDGSTHPNFFSSQGSIHPPVYLECRFLRDRDCLANIFLAPSSVLFSKKVNRSLGYFLCCNECFPALGRG